VLLSALSTVVSVAWRCRVKPPSRPFEAGPASRATRARNACEVRLPGLDDGRRITDPPAGVQAYRPDGVFVKSSVDQPGEHRKVGAGAKHQTRKEKRMRQMLLAAATG
jgi:hypothetical protein